MNFVWELLILVILGALYFVCVCYEEKKESMMISKENMKKYDK